SSPENQVARLQIFQFEGVVLLTKDRLESSGTPQPNVLLARIARHIFHAVLFEHEINKTGAIHPAVRGIGRAVFVIEVARRQFESADEKLLHVGRIIFESFDLFRGQGGVWGAMFCRWRRRVSLWCWRRRLRWRWAG